MKYDFVYYRFKTLPELIRKQNGIRSKVRLDCIEFVNEQAYKGIEFLKNSKGMIYLNKTQVRKFISADSRRLAEWSLTNGSLNLSSLFIEDLEYPDLAYGYPNSKKQLSNGLENPFYEFRTDGYLFITNEDLTEVELIVIPDSRNLIGTYYQLLIDGELDEEIDRLRKAVKPFFDYGYSKL